MKSKVGRICLIVLAVYLVLGVAFYFIAGESLHKTSKTSDSVTPKALVEEFTKNQVIEQGFTCEYDAMDKFGLQVAQASTDRIRVEILDASGTVLYSSEINMAQMEYIPSELLYIIPLDQPLTDAKNKTFTLRMTSLEGEPGSGMLLLYCGNAVNTGRFSIAVETPIGTHNGTQIVDHDKVPASLCLRVYGTDYHMFGQYYWYFYAGGALLLGLYLFCLIIKDKKGKKSLTLSLIASLSKYRFLLKQLVMRDFKTKYKRSVLGMFWSFLNPLLTMSIQFVIFSTLFQSDIENFIVYLLTGIVCFNFFGEVTNMCLMSILGNASLINKVYVPKYIYPFSRTLSSGVNLLLSLLPLFLMLIITQRAVPITILLLPFVLLMLFFLSYGMGLILATMMVFFRDTQFLWSICVMLLNYLSPIFYPETIIPINILPIYRLNPLYQVITFTRKILMIGEGISPPSPQDYLTCILACIIPFILGLWIFKKNEDKFVLNI